MSDQGRSDPFAVLPGLSPPMEPAPATPVWLPLIIARRLLGPAAGLARGLTFTALAWGPVGLVKGWGRIALARMWRRRALDGTKPLAASLAV